MTQIKIHNKWNIHSSKFDGDIAILVVEPKFRISSTIFPICLPSQDDQRALKVKRGIVAGWGKSESSAKHETIPRQAAIDIIDNEQCYLDDPRVAALSSRNTFCGGTGDASGPCNGDSGGPIVVKIGTTWFLRGIVSSGLLNSEKQCDVRSRVVYTNALKFIKWIHQIAEELELMIQSAEDATSGKEVFCFFESWAEGRSGDGAFSVHQFPHELCTKGVFLHAELDGDFIKPINPLQSLPDNGGRNWYRKFTEMKQLSPNFKALLAIGSWNEGSRPYSSLAANARRRSNFAKFVTDYLMKYGFDGIHLHWEYPAHRGGDDVDRQNLVLLLKEIKQAFQKHNLFLSVMVRSNRVEVAKAYDMEGIGKYADAICFFTQDFSGFWFNKIGWNAALYGVGDDTVESRTNFMLEQGAPAEKLLMSLPFYGRSFVTEQEGNIGDKSIDGFPGPFSGENGFCGYVEICHLRKRDSWSQSWNTTANEMIGKYSENGKNYVVTFDTPRSVANKVKFAKEKGLGGVWVWFVTTDDFKAQCPDDFTTFADYPQPIRPPRLERDFPLLRTVNEAMNILSN